MKTQFSSKATLYSKFAAALLSQTQLNQSTPQHFRLTQTENIVHLPFAQVHTILYCLANSRMISAKYDTKLPRGAWDSHVHIFDEVRSFDIQATPLAKAQRDNFRTLFHCILITHIGPRKLTLKTFWHSSKKNSIAHVCLVAITVYGTDNRSILHALTRLKGMGRAVVCIDPDTVTDSELSSMHALGVRGVRLTLRTRGEKLDQENFKRIFLKYAKRLRSFRWVLQIYTSLDQISLIAPITPLLGVPLVI